MAELFVVPISTGGQFVGTTASHDPKDSNIYLLTFTSGADNRLTPEFLDAFLTSLDILEHRFPKGVVITTSGIQKFFSNGLDLEKALTTEGFFDNHLYKLFRRLLTYPMPTVALVNGHAFAGGFMTAMYHDFRVQNPSKGFVCLNEIVLEIPLTPPMRTVFLDKIKDGPTIRSIIVEGKRFAGQEALRLGIVDALGGLEEAVKFVHERKLLDIGKSSAFVALKEGLWKRTLDAIDNKEANDAFDKRNQDWRENYVSEAQKRVQLWESKKGAKL
ncbi:enoyl-CoA hydratase/isomerase family protein [Talaromyces proteolyticus]|uniref:Enoyl-CoA hydratase/isomerase family protein n=1 Tax=Talaromyces proteolyticus TaxID=1131652 RepID=A0AAD4KIJ2_9EURO|nr:enoyl-CoA hydratase/isomerase family protein [Talaromyces proteolyticus]KAH8692032.1 enoyl-CoA hydratase/isomerase family protein [Talaromyces proteolyticus]